MTPGMWAGTATALWLAAGVAAHGQADLCGNIRLSVSEQFECRARLANALSEGDLVRTRQGFEDRIRRATDRLITPQAASGVPAPLPGSDAPAAMKPPPDGADPLKND
jgi:hypothetical protein